MNTTRAYAAHPLLCLLLTLTSVSLAQTGRITPVLVEGQPAPGFAGATLDDVDTPRLGAEGTIAFTARLTGRGVNSGNDKVIYLGKPGAMTAILREGMDVSDHYAEATMNSPYTNHLQLNDNGQITFVSTISGPGVDWDNDSVFWHWADGVLSPLLRENTQVDVVGKPWAGSMPFRPPLSNTGQSVYYTNFNLTTSDEPDTVSVIASPAGSAIAGRTDTLAPGADGGLFWTTSARVMNNHGEIALAGSMHAGVAEDRDTAFWIGTPGNLRMVAREGDAAPGIAGGVFGRKPDPDFVTGGFNTTGFNDNGSVLFTAPVLVGEDETSGMWIASNDGIEKVYADGEAAPGCEEGISFTSWDGVPKITPGDRAAFFASITGPGVNDDNDRGLWLGKSGDLQLVAREGMGVVGHEGLTFDSIGLNSPAINADDVLAFEAGLCSDNWAGTKHALMAWDPATETMHLLLIEGQQVDVDPGMAEDLRTVTSTWGFLQESNGQDGRRRSFNAADGGTLAMRILLEGGDEGVFLVSVPEVPEPASISLLAIGGVALLRRRRR
jgi:hypothetical protein